MTRPDYTHLTLIVDRSGSMSNLAEESSSSINNLIKEQAELEGKFTVSLYQFDTNYDKVFGPVLGKDAPQYRLHARGLTALYDSVYRAINETGEFLRNLTEEDRPAKVVFTVVTDGYENASREVNLATLKQSIAHQTEKYKWEFVFLASGIDAPAVGTAMGINTNVSLSANNMSYAAAYAGVSQSMTTLRSAGKAMSETLDRDYRNEDDSSWKAVAGSVSEGENQS